MEQYQSRIEEGRRTPDHVQMMTSILPQHGVAWVKDGYSKGRSLIHSAWV
jgi:hypothetical protein